MSYKGEWGRRVRRSHKTSSLSFRCFLNRKILFSKIISCTFGQIKKVLWCFIFPNIYKYKNFYFCPFLKSSICKYLLKSNHWSLTVTIHHFHYVAKFQQKTLRNIFRPNLWVTWKLISQMQNFPSKSINFLRKSCLTFPSQSLFWFS